MVIIVWISGKLIFYDQRGLTPKTKKQQTTKKFTQGVGAFITSAISICTNCTGGLPYIF